MCNIAPIADLELWSALAALALLVSFFQEVDTERDSGTGGGEERERENRYDAAIHVTVVNIRAAAQRAAVRFFATENTRTPPRTALKGGKARPT